MACSLFSRRPINGRGRPAKTTGVIIVIIVSSIVIPIVVVVSAIAIVVILDSNRTRSSVVVIVSAVLVTATAETTRRSILVGRRAVLTVLVVLIVLVVLFGIDGRALISHVCVEACLPIRVVGYDLRSAVGKRHSILASYLVAVAGFFAFVVVAAVVVLYLVAKLVSFGLEEG